MKLVMLASGSYKSNLTYSRMTGLGQHLARSGWQVTLIAPSADKYNNFVPDTHPRLDDMEVIQPWQPATRRMIVNLLPYLFTALWALIRARPQVIYLYKPTPITIIGLVPKFLFGTPVVLDQDDLGSEVMHLEGQSPLQVKLVAWCERLAQRYSSSIVVTTTYLEKLMRARYPDKPVLVLSNGINAYEHQAPPKAPPRHMLYYFGVINRLGLVEQFLRALPETLAAMPDTKVQILGGGSALEAAKQLAKDLKVYDRIHFSGMIEKTAVRQYVQFADIALCTQPDGPTVRAASNMKVFQYMSLASVPVVSDVGDLRMYVSGPDAGGQAGVVVPADDVPELSKTLVYLLKHDGLRTNMALCGQKRAETTYAWSTLAARLKEFIEASAGRKGTS